ncbi:MAG: hypothetical protein IKS39_07080 [Clostridia bacterium]|nr:hypothetical protein [Clostridia bacterium]
MFGEMKKLIGMLRKAHIPFEYYCQYQFTEFMKDMCESYGEAGKYSRNQIIYFNRAGVRVFDCILQAGSYGCTEGLLETYGDLGIDENGEPKVMTADEIFKILEEDWNDNNKSNIRNIRDR